MKFYKGKTIGRHGKIAISLFLFAIIFYTLGDIYNNWKKLQYRAESQLLKRNHEIIMTKVQTEEKEKQEKFEQNFFKNQRIEAAAQRSHELKELEWKKYMAGFSTENYGTRPGCNGTGYCESN